MKKSTIIALHITYWVIYCYGLNSLQILPYRVLSLPHLGTYSFYLNCSFILWFYLAYFFLFKLLWKKKILLYGIGTLIIIGGILYVVDITLFGYYLLTLCKVIPLCVTGLLFRFFIDWNKKDKERLQLSQQNLKSELALLRTQINPHFLFNSLHNIDTLITVNPEKASDALLKLSDMMRFVLYDADTDFVELPQEADYLRKYIHLQELRFTNRELIRLEIQLQPEPVKIAPMLFLPFIENAFKHTTGKNEKHGISIQLKQEQATVYFEITNIFDPKQKISKDRTSGIGLSNVKRRLELIYPGKHRLEIKPENGLFQVKLKIDTHA